MSGRFAGRKSGVGGENGSFCAEAAKPGAEARKH